MQIESTRFLAFHFAGGRHEDSMDSHSLCCSDASYYQRMGNHITTGCGRIPAEVSGIQAVIERVLPR
jgi:hypothetical protein